MASGQGNKVSKKYGDDQRSCWEELYGVHDNIVKQHVSFKLLDKEINFEEVRNVIMRQPHVKVVPKSAAICMDDPKIATMVKHTVKEMMAMPRPQTKVVIDVAVAEAIPHVKFYDGNMMPGKKDAKYTAPRIAISLKDYDIPAYHGVRVNTGLVITIPTTCRAREIENGKLKVTNSRVTQESFVIVPQVTCITPGETDSNSLIPSMYVRDADDTGLLTINFTTRRAYPNNMVLQVVLMAFSVDKPMERVSVLNPDTTNGKVNLFKGKDNLSGRAVKNPKIKFLTNNFDLTPNNRQLQMSTFDHKILPITPHRDQKLMFKNITTLFSSRKREWQDPRVITITGLFNPKSKSFASAHVVDGSMFQHNTHCITFVSERLMLFNERVPTVALNARILNGSFSDVPNYTAVNKRLRECVTAMQGLYSGLLSCKTLYNEIQQKQSSEAGYENITLEKLITLYDYDRVSLKLTPNMLHRIHGSHENLFATRSNEFCSAYSVEIKKALCMLAYAFMPHLFSSDELEQLSLRYSNISSSSNDSSANSVVNASVLQPTTTTATENVTGQKRPHTDDTDSINSGKNVSDAATAVVSSSSSPPPLAESTTPTTTPRMADGEPMQKKQRLD